MDNNDLYQHFPTLYLFILDIHHIAEKQRAHNRFVRKIQLNTPVSHQLRSSNDSFDQSINSVSQYQVNAIESSISTKGYIAMQIDDNIIPAVIESGNTLPTEACIGYDITKKLNLNITQYDIEVGYASLQINMIVKGITKFKAKINIGDKIITFFIHATVIEHLSDPINLGVNFLQKFNISLQFGNKNQVLTFLGNGHLKTVPNIAKIANYDLIFQNKTLHQDVDFSQLKDEVFKIVSKGRQMLKSKSISQVNLKILNSPSTNYAYMSFLNQMFQTGTGKVKTVHKQHLPTIQYTTKSSSVILDDGEVIGFAIYFDIKASQHDKIKDYDVLIQKRFHANINPLYQVTQLDYYKPTTLVIDHTLEPEPSQHYSKYKVCSIEMKQFQVNTF